MARNDILRFALLLTIPTLVVVGGLIVFPMVHLVYLSFHTPAPAGKGIVFAGLTNYVALLKAGSFWTSCWVTLQFTFLTTMIPFGIGLLVAVMLNSVERGVLAYRIIFILPMAVAPVVTGLTWRMMLNPMYGVINYLLGFVGIGPVEWLTNSRLVIFTVSVVHSWIWMPYVMILLYAGLQMLPSDVYEAAVIDGAGTWNKFWHVTLPLLQGPIVIAILIKLILGFRGFDIPYTVTGGGPGEATTNLVLYAYLQGFYFFKLEYAAAVGVVMLLIAIAFSRQILKVMPR